MNKNSIDYKIFFSVLSLIIFGMIMVSSVSVYPSFDLTSGMVADGKIKEPYNYFYVLRNLKSIFIALLAFAIVVKIDYQFIEKYTKWIFLASVSSLIYVLLFGIELNGARGWIRLLGQTIQPVEFAKLGAILGIALFLKKYHSYLRSFKKGVLPFLLISGIMVVPIALQPDFGTLLIMLPILTIMFYFAGANMKHLLGLGMVGVLSIVGLYFAGDYDKETLLNKNTLGYITRRVDQFLFSESDENTEAGYQNEQALIAIGSGGVSGLGFGQSIQKFGYLPEVEGDFIFSVIIEELGFIGGMLLISIYIFIGYRGFYIANNVRDLYAKYVAVGISSWIVYQAFINISVNLSIIPNTGVTLPFVSYGGSSLLSLMIALGILLSISRYMEETPAYGRLKNKKLLF